MGGLGRSKYWDGWWLAPSEVLRRSVAGTLRGVAGVLVGRVGCGVGGTGDAQGGNGSTIEVIITRDLGPQVERAMHQIESKKSLGK
jgi:hypothetical protein